jgi:hypothetical protein
MLSAIYLNCFSVTTEMLLIWNPRNTVGLPKELTWKQNYRPEYSNYFLTFQTWTSESWWHIVL